VPRRANHESRPRHGSAFLLDDPTPGRTTPQPPITQQVGERVYPTPTNTNSPRGCPGAVRPNSSDAGAYLGTRLTPEVLGNGGRSRPRSRRFRLPSLPVDTDQGGGRHSALISLRSKQGNNKPPRARVSLFRPGPTPLNARRRELHQVEPAELPASSFRLPADPIALDDEGPSFGP
jgi:hypothetical protein